MRTSNAFFARFQTYRTVDAVSLKVGSGSFYVVSEHKPLIIYTLLKIFRLMIMKNLFQKHLNMTGLKNTVFSLILCEEQFCSHKCGYDSYLG